MATPPPNPDATTTARAPTKAEGDQRSVKNQQHQTPPRFRPSKTIQRVAETPQPMERPRTVPRPARPIGGCVLKHGRRITPTTPAAKATSDTTIGGWPGSRTGTIWIYRQEPCHSDEKPEQAPAEAYDREFRDHM